jgi:hypothetical protein
MPISAVMTWSKWKKATSSLPSRNSTQTPASQGPLAETMPMLTAIQIRVEDAAHVADEDAAAMKNLANRPISEVLRRMLTSRKAETTLPHPPRVARVATKGSKIARRDRQNDRIEIQLPSSLQTMRPMSRLSNRPNAARNLLVVQPVVAMVVVAMVVVAMVVVAMVVVAEATTAAIADVGAANNEVRLAAMETNPAEAENLGAKNPNTAKTAAPRNNAQPANRLQSTMTEMTLSILEMTPAKIPLATKTLRPGTKPSARSSTEI